MLYNTNVYIIITHFFDEDSYIPSLSAVYADYINSK